jgi:hypothetical protein
MFLYSRDYDSRLDESFSNLPSVSIHPKFAVGLFCPIVISEISRRGNKLFSNEMTYYLIPQDPRKYYAFIDGLFFRFYLASMPILDLKLVFVVEKL